MIITWLLEVLATVINFIASLLPNWNLPAIVVTSVTFVRGTVEFIEPIFPVSVLGTALIYVVIFEGLIIISKLIFGVASLIRGGGNIQV